GIVRRHPTDEARLERGAAVLDDLYEAFGGPGGTRPTPRRNRRELLRLADGREPGGVDSSTPIHPVPPLDSGPVGGTDQGQAAPVGDPPAIGARGGKHFADNHFGGQGPEGRPLVPEPVAGRPDAGR